ncbi:MAG: hypothetical protein NTX64_01050 [Elusimicrobia bacterium]|nr:hypothetical protein [Elusimicrobiota bacterium]
MMVVLVVLVTLAAITMERFGGSIRTANEDATRSKLASLRGALQIYYTDTEGSYPSDLTPMLQPGSKYLTTVMPLYTGAHGRTATVNYVQAKENTEDTGTWAYVNTTGRTDWGTVYIQCTHTDSKGSVWNQY